MCQVFISYRQLNDAQRQRVRAFAERLRDRGIDVILDQFYKDEHPGGPPEGWPKWSSDQAENAEKVIIIGNESWFRCYESKEKHGAGLGSACEAGVIRQRIYDLGGKQDFVRVAYLDDRDVSAISLDLKRYDRFHIGRDFSSVVGWLGISSQDIKHSNNETARRATPGLLAARGLNPEFSFDHLVLGLGNIHASACSRAVAEKPGRIYNPLFIHGGRGLGKTHLLHAIGAELVLVRKVNAVCYLSAETFSNEYLDALQEQMRAFRHKYRGLDVLLVDDIEYIAGNPVVQNEFIHTFDELLNSGKQIVLTSSKAPHLIQSLDERLLSRFQGGLIVEVGAPDFETRVAILRVNMQQSYMKVDAWILELIAERVITDVRQLKGLIQLFASHLAMIFSDEERLSKPDVIALIEQFVGQDKLR